VSRSYACRDRAQNDRFARERSRSFGERSRLLDERAQSFRCVNCRLDVPTDALGTVHRNHCPTCLWSKHVDDDPGDRASDCGSSMEPIAITVRKDGEWVLIHRCNGCGVLHSNRIAGDDNPLLLVRIAVRPIAQPPFPLDRLGML
jgi:hypothetical protein